MLLFAFYNAPLIDAATNPSKTPIGFVDNSMFLATPKTLDECHATVKINDGARRRQFCLVIHPQLPFQTFQDSGYELSKTALPTGVLPSLSPETKP